MSADPDLLALWTRGWALTRGVAAPVFDAGGWLIEVGQPDQLRRYVFAQAGEAVAARARAIGEPFVLLKVCDAAEAVRPLLPDRWAIQPPGFMMTLDRPMDGRGPPNGYGPVFETVGAVTFCRIVDATGTEAAQGRAVRIQNRIVYDRIVVGPDHRRRGLGSAVMRALESVMTGNRASRGVLVATPEGRALYEFLGWLLHSPYTTAFIPG